MSTEDAARDFNRAIDLVNEALSPLVGDEIPMYYKRHPHTLRFVKTLVRLGVGTHTANNKLLKEARNAVAEIEGDPRPQSS